MALDAENKRQASLMRIICRKTKCLDCALFHKGGGTAANFCNTLPIELQQNIVKHAWGKMCGFHKVDDLSQVADAMGLNKQVIAIEAQYRSDLIDEKAEAMRQEKAKQRKFYTHKLEKTKKRDEREEKEAHIADNKLIAEAKETGAVLLDVTPVSAHILRKVATYKNSINGWQHLRDKTGLTYAELRKLAYYRECIDLVTLAKFTRGLGLSFNAYYMQKEIEK